MGAAAGTAAAGVGAGTGLGAAVGSQTCIPLKLIRLLDAQHFNIASCACPLGQAGTQTSEPPVLMDTCPAGQELGAEAGSQTEWETPLVSVAVVITWPAGQLVAGGAAAAQGAGAVGPGS